MVITDVPFDARERAKYSRYSLIRRPDSAKRSAYGDEDEEEAANRSKEYATFLKYGMYSTLSNFPGAVIHSSRRCYRSFQVLLPIVPGAVTDSSRRCYR